MTRTERLRRHERLGMVSRILDQVMLQTRIRRWRTLAEKSTRRAERLVLEKRITRTLREIGKPYGLDGRIYSASRSGFLSVREAWQHGERTWLDWTI